MQIIHTENAPGAIGPYSQAVVTGGLVYTSGQIPVDPATGAVPAGIAAQADQSCRNVGAILAAAGSGFDKVVKPTCFLADIADFAAFNEVYAGYFVSKPARSCVAVKDLPKGVLCEVEAIAEVCARPLLSPVCRSILRRAGEFFWQRKGGGFCALLHLLDAILIGGTPAV